MESDVVTNLGLQAGNAPFVHIGEPWKDAHCRLKRFGGKGDNASSTTVWVDETVCTGHQQSMYSSEWDPQSRFYMYNLISELDAEGEFFVDVKASMIYWKPPSPALAAAAAANAPLGAVVSVLPTVISIENATGVELSGLRLLHARGNGVEVIRSTNVVISECTVALHGNLAVNITNSSNASIASSTISGTGDGGVWLEGGSRDDLTPSLLAVSNCTFRNYNRWDRTYRPGVTLVGVGATVRGNDFAEAPHQCVMVVGNDHVIEGNRFTNNVFESGDSGVIYSETDMTFRGNVIRGNTFSGVHSLYYPRTLWAYHSHPRVGGWWGDWVKCIHLDNQVGGFRVEGNTFVNYSYAFDVNGGGQHLIQNNWFGPCPNTSCSAVISLHGSNGDGVTVPCPPMGPPNYTDSIREFDFDRVPSWNSTLWRTRYPSFASMMDARTLSCAPYGNTVANNTYVDVPCIAFPVRKDRASTQSLSNWRFVAEGNTNTVECPP